MWSGNKREVRLSSFSSPLFLAKRANGAAHKAPIGSEYKCSERELSRALKCQELDVSVGLA